MSAVITVITIVIFLCGLSQLRSKEKELSESSKQTAIWLGDLVYKDAKTMGYRMISNDKEVDTHYAMDVNRKYYYYYTYKGIFADIAGMQYEDEEMKNQKVKPRKEDIQEWERLGYNYKYFI